MKTIAAEIGADETLLHRLMRASAGLDLLVEEEGARFRLSDMGQLLSANQARRPLCAMPPAQCASTGN